MSENSLNDLALDAGIAGRTVLVTGAASGIGRRTAELFLEAGATVVGADLNPYRGDSPSTAIDLRQGDLSDEQFVQNLAADLADTGLSSVVHCAGIHGGAGLSTSAADFDRIVATNLRSSFLMLKYMIPILLSRAGGSVILLGSACGLDSGGVCGPAYSASKAGVHALVKWAAREYAKSGIRVNSIAPGPIATPMSVASGVKLDRVPLGHLGEPIDIARLALFISGEAGNFVTGQIWSINGGAVI
jgi:3-oxoacyl-[acyl-carrier protein] reductase